MAVLLSSDSAWRNGFKQCVSAGVSYIEQIELRLQDKSQPAINDLLVLSRLSLNGELRTHLPALLSFPIWAAGTGRDMTVGDAVFA